MDARRRAKTAIRSLSKIAEWVATEPAMTNDIDVLGGTLDAVNDALRATKEVVKARETRLRHELGEARKALDERAGAVGRMDIVDLGRAASCGLISQSVYEEERERRAKNFDRPRLHRTSSTLNTVGATIAGLVLCAATDCSTVLSLTERESGYCSKHQGLEQPRTFVTATFRPVDLDEGLGAAERHFERAKREYEAADEQLKAARRAIERFDAQHRG
jgi:hypothetical protein